MTDTQRKLRVAVIGAGRMGGHHARTYSQLPDCELVAVVDKEAERARRIASEYHARAVTDGGDAAAVAGRLAGVDAVSVCVPTAYHAEVAAPYVERGTPVLVEKPLAPDIASAQRMLDAVRRTGTLLQVGHSERFNPVVQAMLRMGVRPRFIETSRVSPFTFRSADIGVVLDMMIHDIDIVLHLVQQREYTVHAVGVSVLGAHEDVANARVGFADGSVVNLTASRLALKTERRIRVFCPTAYISMDYHKKSGIAIRLDDNLDLIRIARERNFEDLSQMQELDFGSMIKIEPLVVENVDPLRAEIQCFLDSVRTGAAPAVSAEDGFAAVEMAERIAAAVKAQNWELAR
ncbi:MAG: gfo/Idh/MocA family oxidoreductase [Phycisphaerales bacterium]|nr:MAG: gfo/Idh/MocA family oxidoreductase [Phycisphaerales bacterium]